MEEVRGLGLKIGNIRELIGRLNEAERIQNDEILVSFDIKVLFPSMPMKEVLYLFEGWITTHENSEQKSNGGRRSNPIDNCLHMHE